MCKAVLKPDVNKVVLFIVLFVLMMYISPCLGSGGAPPGPYTSAWVVCGSYITFFAFGGVMMDSTYSFFGIADLPTYASVILILLLIVAYLLSCAIISLYRKHKK